MQLKCRYNRKAERDRAHRRVRRTHAGRSVALPSRTGVAAQSSIHKAHIIDMASANYTAKDITVLEGLEPVRKRPGMYIGGVGSAGLHHLVWEVLDNAVDEAMNGYASNIWVTLHADGSSITIEDDGRGIPIDKHPTSKKSALEVIFTVLHAGGKFEHGSYKTAGGLHGVGASVVNALSKELVATVKRDGSQWEMRFKQGKPVTPLKKLGRGARQRDDRLLSSRRRDLPEDRIRSRDHQRAPRGGELPAQGPEGHLRGRGVEGEAGLRAQRRHRRLPEEHRHRRAARSRCTTRRSRWRKTTGSGSISCCSGPSRPRSTCGRTSTASRPARAARTRAACAPASARRCATSSRRTTSRRRASRSRPKTSAKG